MSEQFTIERHGHKIEVELDESLVVVARARLYIDGKLADEQSILWDVRLHGELRDGGKAIPVKVDVAFGLLGDVEKCVLIEDGVEYPMSDEETKSHDVRREAVLPERASPERAPPERAPPERAPPERAPPITDKEGELLAAMKKNGGRITAIRAAMETSLSVKEAEGMLSELASGGYLLVEPGGGAMIYALPGNEPEDGDR